MELNCIASILICCQTCCKCAKPIDNSNTLPLWLIVILVVIIILLLLFFGKKTLRKLHNSFPNNSKISVKTVLVSFDFPIKRSYENIHIANRIYIELITRKAALPIDENTDVIEEVYNSWYTLFKVIREEIKTIPGESIASNSSARELIQLTIEILNKGLRPHLTKYQADFKRWYAVEILKDENKSISPQVIQKKYRDFKELIKSMKEVNETLKTFSEQLSVFIYKK